MKDVTRGKLICTAFIFITLVSLWAIPVFAQDADISGIWQLSAHGVSVGCTVHTPYGINVCGSFGMGDADIHVGQSGAVLSASEGDGNGNPFTLDGTINGSAVTFTIQGTGITPGIGPATTTYTGTLYGNKITGDFSGYASWTYTDGNGNPVTETATWTGSFTVTITATGTGSISGQVSYSGNQTGTIYVGIFSSLADIKPGLPNPLYVTSLTAPGHYTISGIPDGTYYVGAIRVGNASITLKDPYGMYGINNFGDQPLSVTISGGDAMTGIDITLIDGTIQNPNPFYSTISFSGFVRDSSENPVEGAWLEQADDNDIYAISSADGSFMLSGLPSGAPFAVKISKGGYVPTYTANMSFTSNITNITYYVHKQSEVSGWGVMSGKGVIRGFVADSNNNAGINGVTVTAQGTSGNTYQVTYFDGVNLGGSSTYSNGIFFVINVDANDTVTCTASKDGWSFPTREFTVHADSVSRGRVPGTATVAGSISGTVSYSGSQSGTIYVGLFSNPDDIKSGTPKPLYVTSSGDMPSYSTPWSYTLTGVPGGTYYVGAVLVRGPNEISMKDPFGVYGINNLGDHAIPVTISGGNAATGIYIKLVDGTAQNPNPFFAGKIYTLTVSKSGDGGGVVLSRPEGIKCGDDCSYKYENGTNITLLPIADAGSSFSGWSGACSGTGECSVSMDADKAVGAIFRNEGTVQAKTMLSIYISSESIRRNGQIDVVGRLTRLPDMGNDLSGLTIVITITARDGTSVTQSTTTYTREGLYRLQGLTGFTQKGLYSIKTSFKGTPSLAPSDSEAKSLSVNSAPGYAVIVEGKIPSGEGLESHNKTVNKIYGGLLDRGFTDGNIKYFNYNNAQTGVDALPSKAEIQAAVETWAKANMNSVPAPLYFIMVDHGNSDTFYIDKETITHNDLVSWFDKLESGLNSVALQEKRIIIIGSCYSGSYIPYLSKKDRVIITSARADEQSFKGMLEDDNIRSGEFFLDELFNGLTGGYSFSRSFEYAAKKTFVYTRKGGTQGGSKAAEYKNARQHPLLDDNGDGKGSSILSISGDGRAALELYLGTGLSNKFNVDGKSAEITEVTGTVFLNASASSASLWAKADKAVSAAWIQVRPPSMSATPSGGSGQVELPDIPKVRMECGGSAGGALCTVTYAAFSGSGKYEIYYYVKDLISGKVSPLESSVVYKAKEGNGRPSAFGLVSPPDGSKQTTVLTLDWEDSSDIDGFTYTLMVSRNSDFSAIDYLEEEIPYSTTAIGVEDLLSDLTVWYWKVLAVDPYGAITESNQTWSFTTVNDNTNGLPGIISGSINDAMTGAGIPYATLSMSTVGTFTTLPDGSFFMSVPTGTMTLKTSANGYVPSEISVSIYPGTTIENNISMLPTNPCAATLDSDLGLHIPVVLVNDLYLWIDLQYDPASTEEVKFEVTGYGPLSGPDEFKGCQPSSLTGDLKLNVPAITLSPGSVRAEFEYEPSNDGLIWFKLTGCEVSE